MPHLIVHEPGQGPIAVPLREGLVVGRHEESDIPLYYQQVSRYHARFERAADGWLVRDLDSANGTFVGGVRVQEGRLEDGSRIQIGPVTHIFSEQPVEEIVHAQPHTDVPTVEVERASRRLALLLDLTRAIDALDDPDILIGRMLDAVLHLVDGERAAVMLGDGTGREPLRRVVRTRGGASAGDEIIVSRTLMQALLVRRESIIIRDGREEGTPWTLVQQGILSAMGAPLLSACGVLGFLYVDDRSREGRFGPEDLDFLNALARLLAAALDGALRFQRAIALVEAESRAGPLHEILGQSLAIQRLRVQIAKCAAAPTANVLIRGESGTGKELVAGALHAASPRAHRPLIAVNCAAIPDTMIEGELFGYERGSFTGAIRGKRGRFTLANQGTLFLDEIGDLSLPAQAKVLRALQDGEILPLGSEEPHRVDVRVLSATHKDLRREIAEGRFREDLYYRLDVVEIEVPPLRERGADIELLAQAFMDAAALRLGKRMRGFSPAAFATLSSYAWPGNVRELKNEVERAIIQAEGPSVELEDLSPHVRRSTAIPASTPSPPASGSLAARFAALEPTEKALVEEALAAARGNLTEAARQLGITRIMMRRRVKRFGLRFRDA